MFVAVRLGLWGVEAQDRLDITKLCVQEEKQCRKTVRIVGDLYEVRVTVVIILTVTM